MTDKTLEGRTVDIMVKYPTSKYADSRTTFLGDIEFIFREKKGEHGLEHYLIVKYGSDLIEPGEYRLNLDGIARMSTEDLGLVMFNNLSVFAYLEAEKLRKEKVFPIGNEKMIYGFKRKLLSAGKIFVELYKR